MLTALLCVFVLLCMGALLHIQHVCARAGVICLKMQMLTLMYTDAELRVYICAYLCRLYLYIRARSSLRARR